MACANLCRAGLPNMQLRVRIGYVLIAVTYIATICSILFGCHPMHKNWQINPNPGSMYTVLERPAVSNISPDHCQPAVSKIDIYVTVVLNVSTDIYLITIPAPVLPTAP